MKLILGILLVINLVNLCEANNEEFISVVDGSGETKFASIEEPPKEIINVRKHLAEKKDDELTFSASIDLGGGYMEAPKTTEEREKLFSRIEKLKKAGVLFVGINTFPTIEKTWDSIKYAIEIQQRFGVAMVPHITAGNVEEAVLVDMLNTLKEGGVQNIFALVGGMPPKHWLSVTPILDFIKQKYGDYFWIQVTGYPFLHKNSKGWDEEIEYTKLKIDKGGNMIVTQPLYELEAFFKFEKACRDIGIAVPIVPDLMPAATYEDFQFVSTTRRTRVPQDLMEILGSVKGDPVKFKATIMNFTLNMIKTLYEAGINHFEFDDRVQTDFIVEIIEKAKLFASHQMRNIYL